MALAPDGVSAQFIDDASAQLIACSVLALNK